MVDRRLELNDPFRRANSLTLNRGSALFEIADHRGRLSTNCRRFKDVRSFVRRGLNARRPCVSVLSRRVREVLFVVLRLVVSTTLRLRLSTVVFLVKGEEVERRQCLHSVERVVHRCFQFDEGHRHL